MPLHEHIPKLLKEDVLQRVKQMGMAQKDKAAGGVFGGTHRYIGISATRGMLAVSPELEKWVGKQLSEEYLAIKERRQAIEAASGTKK